jgi:Histidine kinase-, DNA gyrase B-, and HSP90-like ATPase
VNLRDLGLEAIENIRFQDLRLKGGDDGITVSLHLIGEGGPGVIRTDRAVLLRVLAHLLENSVREVVSGGKVTLQITSYSEHCGKGAVLVEVIDNGKGLPAGTCLDNGGDTKVTARPAPSHRYVMGRMHSNDPDEIQKVRSDMEDGLRNLKQNGIGVGLPLSCHLVRMLGGDLRQDKLLAGTRIYFSLQDKLENDMDVDNRNALESETIYKKGLPPTFITFVSEQEDKKCRRMDDAEFGNFVSSDSSTNTVGDDSSATQASDPAPGAVAKCGVKASMPFSVLIVEDTEICARVLAMQLKKVSHIVVIMNTFVCTEQLHIHSFLVLLGIDEMFNSTRREWPSSRRYSQKLHARHV